MEADEAEIGLQNPRTRETPHQEGRAVIADLAAPPRYYRAISARWWLAAVAVGVLLWAAIAALIGVALHA